MKIYQMIKSQNYLKTYFDRKYNIDYNVFYLEYSKIFKTYFERKGYMTLFIDFIKFDDESLGVLDCISKLNESNLIIFTFKRVIRYNNKLLKDYHIFQVL